MRPDPSRTRRCLELLGVFGRRLGPTLVFTLRCFIATQRTEIGGYAAATKLLRELHPREHLLIGTMNDAIALGALRAVREAGRERLTAIVSQDFSPDPRVSAAIRDPDSPFAGSVAFFPERYGSKIIPAVLRWLNKEQVPPSFYTDHAMVTADNVERFCSVNDSQPAR